MEKWRKNIRSEILWKKKVKHILGSAFQMKDLKKNALQSHVRGYNSTAIH